MRNGLNNVTTPKIEVFQDFSNPKLLDAWEELEKNGTGTPYNSWAWASSWYTHIGAARGIKPYVIVAYVEDEPVALLPLALQRKASLTVIRFLADKIGNQNTGFWKTELLEGGEFSSIAAALRQAIHESGCDIIQLRNMSQTIEGLPNPLFRVSDQLSTNAIYPFELFAPSQDFMEARRSKRTRSGVRQKRRRLQGESELVFVDHKDLETQASTLDTLIRQRDERQALTGIPNAFSVPEVRAFLHDFLKLSAEPRSGVRATMHSIELDGEVLATNFGALCHKTFYCYSLSIISDERTRNSPGLILSFDLIAQMCDDGLERFDYGVGKEDYKLGWAEPDYLRDWIEATTAKGRALAATTAALLKGKQMLRDNKLFWKTYRSVRGALRRAGL
ncbi:GNAT family N-acetyltransferase [Rhodobacteraceae bacterium RKSG542]|uniref:GNAT family N-acetyltransferase n=1 Tax=Pseudovibrio flavus TaxID=2529854 RepID=UPI0012BC58D7|nr:GNAT family N-acetyltransferase [Pseudovibrio flavus]MTI17350.1 GNAT family N-acetyltransferase [Pseudovibrio flavus]